MEQFLLPNADPETRRDTLEGMAYKITESEKYDRRLSEDEIHERRERSLKVMDALDDIAAEKKTSMDGFKVRISEKSQELGTLRREAKTGITTEVGKLYAIPDYEARKMGFYNERGELMSSRGLLPEERQQNMFVSRAVGE